MKPGEFGPTRCRYCREKMTVWFDYLNNAVCDACWPAVRDSLGRWGDLRAYKRTPTDEEKRIPHGEWEKEVVAVT